MPVYAVTGASARRHLWPARAHRRRHTYAPVRPVIIHGIRAYFGNSTQITLICMPVSAESLHRKQCITADIVWPGEARPSTAREVEGGRVPGC
jgi:hypothetical protein